MIHHMHRKHRVDYELQSFYEKQKSSVKAERSDHMGFRPCCRGHLLTVPSDCSSGLGHSSASGSSLPSCSPAVVKINRLVKKYRQQQNIDDNDKKYCREKTPIITTTSTIYHPIPCNVNYLLLLFNTHLKNYYSKNYWPVLWHSSKKVIKLSGLPWTSALPVPSHSSLFPVPFSSWKKMLYVGRQKKKQGHMPLPCFALVNAWLQEHENKASLLLCNKRNHSLKHPCVCCWLSQNENWKAVTGQWIQHDK